jgi:copper/silver efflux system protein
MQRLVSVMRRAVTSVLVIWLVSLAAPCAAQELDALDLAYEKASREGRLRTLADLQVAIVEGGAKRLRPKFMARSS